MTSTDVRESVAFGQSTEAQREAWRRRHYAAPREESRRLGQVADAYAHGWIACRTEYGQRLSDGQFDELLTLAYAFGLEYEHAAWLYATERSVSREGYGRAWEQALAAHGWAARRN